MKRQFSVAALIIGLILSARTRHATGQAPTPPVRVATATPAVASQPKFTFLLFWKENAPATQTFTESLKAGIAKRGGQIEVKTYNVADAANQAIVQQYQVSRAPMPIAVCVAHNGAITGAIVRQVTDESIERVLATPAMIDVTKALQDKQIVLIHVKQDENTPLPYGGLELTTDPAFQARTKVVPIVLTDAAEARFIKEMQINPAQVDGSMLVVLGPPAVLVGKFPASVTKDQIAAALHAAGKCCNDPNCKHNQKAQ